VKRPSFDLGLWSICTAVPFAVSGAIIAYGVWEEGWYDRAANDLVFSGSFSLVLGCVIYNGCQGAGLRISRPRPEQAEDYGDGG
jgi:hypothetical protein